MKLTVKEFHTLCQLRDLASALDDQIDTVSEAIGNLTGLDAGDDAITDLVCNGRDLAEFMRVKDIQVETCPEETHTCDKCGKKAVPESDCTFGDGVTWCNQCCADHPDEMVPTGTDN